MYEKVATVTVSIEEIVSLGQGERGPDNPVSQLPMSHRLARTSVKAVSVDNFALGTKDRLTGYGKKPDRLVQA